MAETLTAEEIKEFERRAESETPVLEWRKFGKSDYIADIGRECNAWIFRHEEGNAYLHGTAFMSLKAAQLAVEDSIRQSTLPLHRKDSADG